MSDKDFFERNKNVTNRFIRNFLARKKTPIVHGGRAQNVQLPKNLERKPSKDWDIFTQHPELKAHQLERTLDKRFGGDFFRVKKGKTTRLRVNKVVGNIDNESVADFSKPDRKVPFVTKRSVRFASLKDQFEKAKSNIKDPSKVFRRKKDLSLIRRVKQFQKPRSFI